MSSCSAFNAAGSSWMLGMADGYLTAHAGASRGIGRMIGRLSDRRKDGASGNSQSGRHSCARGCSRRTRSRSSASSITAGAIRNLVAINRRSTTGNSINSLAAACSRTPMVPVTARPRSLAIFLASCSSSNTRSARSSSAMAMPRPHRRRGQRPIRSAGLGEPPPMRGGCPPIHALPQGRADGTILRQQTAAE